MSLPLRSLRGRLLLLLLLLIASAVAAGILMVDLFRQSATAQAGRAEAEIARGCDAIVDAYRFYEAGRKGPPPSLDDETRRSLTAVVQTALRNRRGIEGGIWQTQAGSLAYAFPTYEGGRAKTDVPEAELPRIEAVNRAALAAERPVSSRYEASSQILLMTACPLPGPISQLTGWTMTRVFTFAGRNYRQLMAGLGILLASVFVATMLVTRLIVTWSRHLSGVERALRVHDIAELPMLPQTGERELDRLVAALNDAGKRLAAARQRADQLARQVVTGERLAAIGRVSAGIAHEIRNPIAAMRLRAESALAGDDERRHQALLMILEQVERLDTILRRLLTVTEREALRRECVALRPFLECCVRLHSEPARAKGITIQCRADEEEASIDRRQMRGALENLILNAIAAAPAGSVIQLTARHESENLIIAIHDEGPGPPASISDRLFEPFVTGRADGTGLGLSIVREVAAAHGGSARMVEASTGTIFEIVVPWQPS